jgi:hypothetical protein
MTILDKDEYLFERDDKGELIPRKVTLGVKGSPEIKITPIPRGEWRKIQLSDQKEEDIDKNIILNHCVEPKFTEKEIEDLNPILATAIVTAIATETIGTKSNKEGLNKAEELIKKK